MLTVAAKPVNLYVASGQRRGNDPLHWIILAVPQGSDRCTYYHVTGGPTQNTKYQLQIQANKRVDSNGIASKEIVGTIAQNDINKLKSSAQRITPQYCQTWVVMVLADLEQRSLIPLGTSETWQAKTEMDPHA